MIDEVPTLSTTIPISIGLGNPISRKYRHEVSATTPIAGSPRTLVPVASNRCALTAVSNSS